MSRGGKGRAAAPGTGAGVEKRRTTEICTDTGWTWRSESAVVRRESRGRAAMLDMARGRRVAILVVIIVTTLLVVVISTVLDANHDSHLGRRWWSWREKYVRGKFYIEGPPACNSNPGRTVLYAVKHDVGDSGGTRVSDIYLGGSQLSLECSSRFSQRFFRCRR